MSYPQDDYWVVKKDDKYLTVNGWGKWFFSDSWAVFPDEVMANQFAGNYGGEAIYFKDKRNSG